MGGLDVGAVVHWIGQYEDDNVDLVGNLRRRNTQAPNAENDRNPDTIAAGCWQDGPHARKITDWTTLDLILNYTFNYPAPRRRRCLAMPRMAART